MWYCVRSIFLKRQRKTSSNFLVLSLATSSVPINLHQVRIFISCSKTRLLKSSQFRFKNVLITGNSAIGYCLVVVIVGGTMFGWSGSFRSLHTYFSWIFYNILTLMMARGNVQFQKNPLSQISGWGFCYTPSVVKVCAVI